MRHTFSSFTLSNAQGQTPLQLATENEHEEMVEFLKEAGAAVFALMHINVPAPMWLVQLTAFEHCTFCGV